MEKKKISLGQIARKLVIPGATSSYPESIKVLHPACPREPLQSSVGCTPPATPARKELRHAYALHRSHFSGDPRGRQRPNHRPHNPGSVDCPYPRRHLRPQRRQSAGGRVEQFTGPHAVCGLHRYRQHHGNGLGTVNAANTATRRRAELSGILLVRAAPVVHAEVNVDVAGTQRPVAQRARCRIHFDRPVGRRENPPFSVERRFLLHVDATTDDQCRFLHIIGHNPTRDRGLRRWLQ